MGSKVGRIDVGAGQIKHKLSSFNKTKTSSERQSDIPPEPPSIFETLLTRCVIRQFRQFFKTKPFSRPEKASYIQGKFQRSCFRLIGEHGAAAKKTTYMANCRPCGFFVLPETTFCRHFSVCPWCLVRQRLAPIYNALRSIPEAERKSLRITVWGFPLQYHGAPCPPVLDSRRQNPAVKLQSVVSVYTSVVRGVLAPEDQVRVVNNRIYPGVDSFYTQWLGITVSPKAIDAAAVIHKLYPDITVLDAKVPLDDHNFMTVLEKHFYYPELLLQFRNLGPFNDLVQLQRKKGRSLRIKKYKESN